MGRTKKKKRKRTISDHSKIFRIFTPDTNLINSNLLKVSAFMQLTTFHQCISQKRVFQLKKQNTEINDKYQRLKRMINIRFHSRMINLHYIYSFATVYY